jgi:hypothetical protein
LLHYEVIYRIAVKSKLKYIVFWWLLDCLDIAVDQNSLKVMCLDINENEHFVLFFNWCATRPWKLTEITKRVTLHGKDQVSSLGHWVAAQSFIVLIS